MAVERFMGPQWLVPHGDCGEDSFLVWGYGTRDPRFQAVIMPVLFDGSLHYSLCTRKYHLAWCTGASLAPPNDQGVPLVDRHGNVKLVLASIANYYFLEDLQQPSHEVLAPLLPESQEFEEPIQEAIDSHSEGWLDDSEQQDAAVDDDLARISLEADAALGELSQELAWDNLEVGSLVPRFKRLAQLSSGYPYATRQLDLRRLGKVLGRFLIARRQLEVPKQVSAQLGTQEALLGTLIQSLAAAIAAGLYDALNHAAVSLQLKKRVASGS